MFELLEALKYPVIVALVYVNYLLIKQNNKLINIVNANTAALSELSALIHFRPNTSRTRKGEMGGGDRPGIPQGREKEGEERRGN